MQLDARIDIELALPMGHSGAKRVPLEQCRSIYDSSELGVHPNKIAKYHKLPVPTVYNIIRRMSTSTVKKKQGRPPKLDEKLESQLEQFIDQNRFESLDKIAARFSSANGITISKSTLRRYYKNMGFHSRRAAEKPFLREKNVMKRTLWGLMYMGWTMHEWSKVLVTDESTFNLKPVKHNVRCLRRKNERFEIECMKPTYSSGRKSINVWGAFCFHGRMPLVRITGSFENRKYREIIDQKILPYATNVWGSIQEFTLLEDNCGPHKATSIKNYLDGLGVQRMFWPAQSPDLNPIENAWAYMKADYRKRTRFAKNEDECFRWICEIWSNIPQSYFHTLLQSMSSRARLVVDRKGLTTKY